MANSLDLQSLGRRRLNPLAWKTNVWKLTSDLCECGPEPTCMDWVSLDLNPARTFSSIDWKNPVTGVTVTIDITDTASGDLAAVKDAIEMALNQYENNPYVEFVVSSTDAVLFKHYGSGILSALNFTSGGAATTARVCVMQQFCTFKGSGVTFATPIAITKTDGSTVNVAFAGGPFAYTDNSGDDATAAAGLKAALYNALSGAGYVGVDGTAGVNSITVTPNTTTDKFDVVLPRLRGVRAVTINSIVFTKTVCSDDFAAI